MSTPRLLVLALILSGCAEMEQLKSRLTVDQTPPTARIYVANESSNSVSVIDAASFKQIALIDPKNTSTHDLALSRDGTRLYATNLASGRLSVIDTRGLETIASIYTGKRCHVVALTNDNRQAWVANIGENTVSIVDTATYRVVGTIAVGHGPTGLAFSHDGKFAYVSNQGDRAVAVVDTASLKVIKTIPVGESPHFLTLGPDGRIWGANSGSKDIYIIDPATQTKLASLDVGANPQQIAFAYRGMNGLYAYVTLSGANQIAVVNTELSNLRVVARLAAGEKPNGIWANAEGTRLYVGHEVSNDLRVIDTGSNALIATVPLGKKPIRVVASR
ncbi:beta-propeller fold lactonase family protein [Sulfuricella sp. T08]|uniref:YncE family protein n=1 Tax=Sulfuricella sp. T08 TaxID=1632857 RepID=UPI00075071BC|nr:beta-propeller fold lactonase family protein [Sulfuricella sp. T08]